MRIQNFNVCIIGGGAAGLAAAASLRGDLNICILEKNEILGRKVMATGGGRCNLTNAGCSQKQATLDFFASLGMQTCKDSVGRYYPFSEYAPDVVKVLTDALGSNVDILTSCNVEATRQQPDGSFCITGKRAGEEFEILADMLILAAGGKAAPQFGTSGDGYRFARQLGHTVTRLRPILTGIECESDGGSLEELKGIRAKADVSLLHDGAPVLSEEGEFVREQREIQFIKDGVSGICIFNLTPHMAVIPGERPSEALRHYSLKVDLAPGIDSDVIAKRISSFGILNQRLAERIDREGADLKAWYLKVSGLKGWRGAQCTGGGVPLAEIDMQTMESNITKNLFFAGEIINVQGPCGGYNLQNAWETGIKAARAINQRR